MTAAQLDREQLLKLLGMFGSAQGGEIAAAGRAADRMRREAGMTWRDIVVPAPQPPDSGGAIADQIGFVLGYPGARNEWERTFAHPLARQRRSLTEKQRAILRELVAKCRAAATAAA